MGAEQFVVRARGINAQDAFNNARESAYYEYGHRGYTGTIAEKHEFQIIPLPVGISAEAFVQAVQRFDPERDSLNPLVRDLSRAYLAVDDKWGPAGCVVAGKDEWIFFGWASS